MRRHISAALLSLLVSASATPASGETIAFTYGGRLTEANGKPIDGPVNIEITFYPAETGGAPLGSGIQSFSSIPLAQGVFNLSLNLQASDYHSIFNDFHTAVWVEVKDATHEKVYARQKVASVPLAALTPVDGKTIHFDDGGMLAIGPSAAPAAGQFLTKDGSGNFVWAYPPSASPSLQGQTVNAPAPAASHILQYDGSAWVNVPVSSGTITSLSVSPPLAVATSSTTPALSMTTATSVSGGYLTASDWLSFNNKQTALGFTPANKAGDAMSGTLNMGGQNLTNVGAATAANDALNKTVVDTAFGAALKKDGSTPLTGDWTVANHDILGVNTLKAGSLQTTGQIALRLDPYGATTGKTGEMHFSELSIIGGHYVGFKAPDTISASSIWTLPATDGAAGNVLRTDGSGHLSWIDPSLAAGSVSSVAGRTGAVTLTSDDVAEATKTYQTDAHARAFAVQNTIVDGVTDIAPSQNAVTSALANTLDKTGGTMTGALNLGNNALNQVNNATATSIATGNQAGLTLKPFGSSAGQTGEFRLKELSIVRGNYVGFKAPDVIAASKVFTLPAGDGSAGMVLKTDGSGHLTWVSPSSLAVADVITDGVTTIAPSQNAVHDALALKVSTAGDALTGTLNMGSQNITGLGAPTAGGDLATRAYTDAAGSVLLKTDGSVPLTGNWAVGGSAISNVGSFDAASAALASVTTSSQAGLTVKAFGASPTQTGEVRLQDLAADHYAGFKAPDSLSGNQVWTLPPADGSANQVLTTDGSGHLVWGNAGALSIVDGINDGVTTSAPSQNAVFDALALKLNKAGGTLTGPLAMSSQKITNVATPTANGDIANQSYVDGTVSSYLLKDGTTALTGPWAVGGFNITGIGTFNAGAATFASVHTAAQDGVNLNAYGAAAGNTGEIHFKELAATNRYVGFKAPDTVATNTVWVLPATDGTANQVLKTDGSATLGWASISSVNVADSITDGVTTVAPSQNAVFDALATKLSTAGGTFSGPLDVGGNRVLGVSTATTGTDAINKTYADSLAAPYLKKDGSTTLTADWATGGFNITGISAFAATSATVADLATSAQAAGTLAPYGTGAGNTAETRFRELTANGTNYVGFKAPNSIAADQVWTLPAADGAANTILTTDGSGHLSFAAPGSITVQDTITDGVTTLAPSQNAVYDALALKLNTAGGTLSGALDMSATKLTNVATPTTSTDAANKAYSDSVVSPYVKLDGSTPLTGNWAVGGFNFANVGAFSATSVAASSLTTSGQAALTIAPYSTGAGQTGELQFKPLTGSTSIGFKAPDTIAANQVWTLPAADGSSGYALKTDGTGKLGWAPVGTAVVQDAIVDGVTTLAPSQNAVFDALALKMDKAGGTLTGALNMGSNTVQNVATPTAATDAANKSYVTSALAPYVKLDGTVPLTANWAAGGFNMTGINNAGATATTAPSVSTNGQAAVTVGNYGSTAGQSGELRLRETSGSHYVGFKAPDAIASNVIWTWPATAGAANKMLRNDGSGNLTWITPDSVAVADAIVDGVTNVAPSENAVFDALALKLNKTGGTLSGALDMGSNKITNAGTPSATTDLATKGSIDTAATAYIKRDGSLPLTAAWAVGGFNITGVNTFTAGPTTMSSVTTGSQNGLVVAPYSTGAGQTGELQFQELSVVTHRTIGFKAPDTIAASTIWTLPAADGSANNVLKTNGSGALGFASPNTLTVANALTDNVTNIAPAEDIVATNLALKVAKAGDTLSADLNMNSNAVTNVPTPSASTDAANKGYVDSSVTGYLKADGSTPLTANWALGGVNLSGVTTVGAGATSVASVASTGAVSGTTLSSSAQAAFTLGPYAGAAGNTGELRFNALSGSNYVGFKAPDTIGSNVIWTLPAADGSANQVLKTTSGALGWASPASVLVTQTMNSGTTTTGPSENVVYNALQPKTLKAGDTMTGTLNLPAGGLNVGSSQLLVTSGGNVGINQSSPGFPLNFQTAYGDKVTLWNNSGNTMGFGIQNGVTQIHTATSAEDIGFGGVTSGTTTTKSIIKGTGDVGFGTTSPEARLHVKSTGTNGSEQGTALLDSGNTGSGSGQSIEFKELALSGTGGGYMGSIASVDNGSYGGRLEFRLSSDAAVTSSRLTNTSTAMAIHSTGDVGVGLGTATPGGRLHLQKTLGSAVESPLLILDSSNGVANGGSSIQFKTNNSQAGYTAAIAGLDDGSYDGRLEFRVSSDGSSTTSALTSADTKMTIKRNGNIGILESNPGFPLVINNVANGLGQKVLFHGAIATPYGLGIQASTLQIHTPNGSDIGIFYGTVGSVTESMRFTSTGRLGINTTTPDANAQIVDRGILVGKPAGDYGISIGICSWGACSNDYETIQLATLANLRLWFGGTESVIFKNDGSAQKGGTAAWTNLSDIRTKDVHGTYDLGLKEILQLSPIVYSYKKDNPRHYNSDFEFVGFSAQEVQKVIPRAVTVQNDGYLSLNADPIMWAMLNALKEENHERHDASAHAKDVVEAARKATDALEEQAREDDDHLDQVKAKLKALRKTLCEQGSTKECEP